MVEFYTSKSASVPLYYESTFSNLTRGAAVQKFSAVVENVNFSKKEQKKSQKINYITMHTYKINRHRGALRKVLGAVSHKEISQNKACGSAGSQIPGEKWTPSLYRPPQSQNPLQLLNVYKSKHFNFLNSVEAANRKHKKILNVARIVNLVFFYEKLVILWSQYPSQKLQLLL